MAASLGAYVRSMGPQATRETLLACARTDMFMAYFERVKALMPAARAVVTEGTGTEAALRATVAQFEAFLE